MISTKDNISIEEITDIRPLNKNGSVLLCRKASSGELCVKKTLNVYDPSIYEYLLEKRPRGIPKIGALYIEDGSLVVIEEYIDARPLSEIIAERGPMDQFSAMEILQKICEILIPLHASAPPIVHRDIKPSNILLSESGDVFLIDFNAATKYSEEKDQDTVLIGTTGYAAPEQYGFKASDPRADIYALGRVAQELFTGEKTNPENYDGPCKDVIIKCLRLDPADRYADASALRAALTLKQRQGQKQRLKKDPVHKWYIPPGFRTKNPLHITIAIIGYIMFYIMLTPYSDGRKVINTGADVFVLIFFATEFLFALNYMGIQSRLPLSSSQNIVKRIIGVALYMFIILLIYVVLANILGAIGIIELQS